jgi:hypothetical protein
MTAANAPSRGREPLPGSELYILAEPRLTKEICRDLLDFNRAYQQRNLAAFLRFKYDWHETYPDKTFPGVCAEVDSITGEMRPLEEQHAWTWGDGRGLGLWAAFLIKGRIADEERTLTLALGATRTLNMKEEYEAYCDHVYRCLVDRYEACGGRFPYRVDIDTNRPSDDDRNLVPDKDAVTASDIFCLTAMFQYAMLRDDARALDIGQQLLERCATAARTGQYSRKGHPAGHRFQGSPMITVGALVDILKTIAVLEARGGSEYTVHKPALIGHARDMIDYILGHHYDPESGTFWEENGPDGRPWINEKGQQICDPGHTAEACGFFAELCSFLPEPDDDPRPQWRRDEILDAIVRMCDLVTRHGFSERGIMYKNIDLKMMRGVPDTSGGGAAADRPTAPWWNVREHCAACLKLYELTAHEPCLEGYRRSQNASYLHYPNARIGGLMVQTLDPHTLEPLDIHPATGNLDPMHSARAREREIEALETMLPRLS